MRHAILLFVLAALPTGVAGQLSLSGFDPYVTYRWSNASGLRTGDTLVLRSVLINVSDRAQPGRLPCEISVETDLDLGPATTDCDVPVELAPGDSAWTTLRAVVESPPGDYRMSWEAGGRRSGFVRVTAATASPPGRDPPRRLPYVLELMGPGAERHTEQDFVGVMQPAISEGAGGNAVVFPVSETAAAALGGFEPVARFRLEFDGRGQLEFHRCWEGRVPTSLADLCGLVSRGGHGSDLHLGATLHRLLVREGRYFGRSGG